jgi:hypothetical protein
VLCAILGFFIGYTMSVIVAEVIMSGTATMFVCFAQDPAILRRNNPVSPLFDFSFFLCALSVCMCVCTSLCGCSVLVLTRSQHLYNKLRETYNLSWV